MVVGSSEKAEEKDQGEEDDDERDVGAEGTEHEDERDKRHDYIVVGLTRIPRPAGRTIRAVCGDEGVGWVVGIGCVDPVRAVDDEDDEGESVAKDELADTGNVHGDAAEEVEGAADGHEGCRVGSLELEKTEHGRGERDEETEDAEQGWVT